MKMIKISNDDFHEPHDDDDFNFTNPMLMNLHVLITVQPMVSFDSDFAILFKSEPMNLAYTSATLGLHLDLPFYEYTPGVQVFLYEGSRFLALFIK